MARKNKFIKGEVIRDPLLALDQILKGNYLFYDDKPTHPSWLRSMQIGFIATCAKHGKISLAILNPERKNDE